MFSLFRSAYMASVTTAVVVSTFMAGTLPVFSQTVGVNSAVRNNVRVRQGASAPAQQAQIKQPVKMGNAITTGTNSALQVTLLDQSSLTLGPNGSLTVDRFVYNPARSSSSVASSVTKGAFRFMSGRSTAGGRNSMTTPAASIGIRGTILEGAVGVDAIAIAGLQEGLPTGVAVDPTTATVIVLRGPGPQAPGTVRRGIIDVTAGGKTITLNRPGSAVFVPRAGATPIPFQLNNAAFQQFDNVLRSQPGSFLANIVKGPQSRGQSLNQGNEVGIAQSTGPVQPAQNAGLGTKMASAVVKNNGGFFGSFAGLAAGIGAATTGAVLAAQGPSSP